MGTTTTADFLGLERVGDTWRLPITSRTIGGGRNSLFGGVGLAVGILALEEVTGQPAVWATGQYASPLFEPATLELAVELPAVGRTVTQGRVVGRSDGGEIVSVIGATGHRTEVHRGVWESMPDAPDPDACPDVERDFDGETIHDHVEVRVARGMFGFSGVGAPSGDHRTLLWARMPEVEIDRAALAIIADYSPSSLGNAVGARTSITSLDNTIRFADPAPANTDWILCDNRVDFVGNGFGHGTSFLWAADGTMLATASQSMTVVVPKD